MAISFPLALPTTQVARRVRFGALSAVGVSASPFTFAQQVFAHQGGMWRAEVEIPPMKRADAAAWIAFLVKLNGREGTFLMGDPTSETPRGTWSAGAPVLSGAHARGAKTLTIRGVDGRTWKEQDWFQIGSGDDSRLHMVVQDGQQIGSPSTGSVEIWPALRTDYSDGAALTVSAAKGRWRLSSNERAWDVDLAQVYGLQFSCEEAL